MNNSEFKEHLLRVYEHLCALTASKGEEYKGADPDQFGNFNRLAIKLDLPREKILMVYLTKHLDSIETFIRELQASTKRPMSEPIDGRILDAILYLVLLLGMIQESRKEKPDASNRIRPLEAGSARPGA